MKWGSALGKSTGGDFVNEHGNIKWEHEQTCKTCKTCKVECKNVVKITNQDDRLRDATHNQLLVYPPEVVVEAGMGHPAFIRRVIPRFRIVTFSN